MTPPPLIIGIFLIALLGITGNGIGRKTLKLIRVSTDQPLYGIYAIALGIGLLQFVPFFLLSLGIANPTSLRLASGVLFLLSLTEIRPLSTAIITKFLKLRRSQLWERFAAALLICTLSLALLRAVCPITDDDGLSYHLTAAVRLLNAGRFVLLPTFTYTNWPLGVESIYIYILGITRHAPVGIVQFLFALITMVAVMLAARRISGSAAGWAAGALMFVYKVFWKRLLRPTWTSGRHSTAPCRCLLHAST